MTVYLLHLAVLVGIYAVLAQGLNILMGFTGVVSVMQASFFGVGAYISALLALRAGMPFPATFVLAGIGAAGAGLLIGTLIARLRGDYLALVTFAIAVIFYDVFNNWLSLTNGPMGIPGITEPFQGEAGWVFFVAALVIVTSIMVRRIDTSAFGRLLKAVRDDEELALAMGRNVRSVKAVAFTLSALLAGAAGSAYAHYITFIDPSSFTVMESVNLLAMVVIGGMASTSGPFLGVGFLIFTTEALRFLGLPLAVAASVRQALFGLLVVLAMLYRPQGLTGRYGLRT